MWCWCITFGGVLVFMADSGVKKHGKKRARDDFKAAGVTSTSPAWSEIDELYEGSTFRSSLLGWNLKCEITGKRFVPYWWEGGHFEVDGRHHGNLPRFQAEGVLHRLKGIWQSGEKNGDYQVLVLSHTAFCC